MDKILCPICNSQLNPLIKQGDFSWQQCPTCDFVMLDNNISIEQEKEYQGEDIGKKYLNGYLAPKKYKAKNRRSYHRAKILKKHLKTGNDILDIGSNVGFFCNASQNLGLNATGVEINKVLYDFARENYPKCSFYNSPLEETEIKNKKFDGVYCSEVIEHVIDVKDFLTKAAALIKKDGVLYLTTPSSEEYISQKAPKENWKNFGAPDHKLYFNKKNIKQFLENNGFRDVKFLFSFFSKSIKLICYKK